MPVIFFGHGNPMNALLRNAYTNSWGLDHGTWSELRHVFPRADIPVVQLSIDETRPPEFHYELAKGLQPLRDEGVLVIGSGNIIHYLHCLESGLVRLARQGAQVRYLNKLCFFTHDGFPFGLALEGVV